ncbi:MAG: class II fructose-bisphosphate aldolase [Candidatus Diapherotrites archaeon]|nr:class II fructose-bisphosphate aldolase [Candidatus Diapherotrites archaeon]
MKPISSHYMFEALADEPSIIMACNTRTSIGLIKGIFRAAKEMNAPIIFELAKTECNLSGGYTGFTPKMFAEKTMQIAEEVNYDCWALHADHLTIKKGTSEEIEDTKKLIKAQIDAGYTSFAIDASHLFNYEGKNTREELTPNINATIELAEFIKKNHPSNYGLEVEVGEIGKTDEHGRVLTKPEEAVEFITALKEKGIEPHAIAIANGSVHGNTYDEKGRIVPQSSIDIPQTIKVAEALAKTGSKVRIAQHGITGTPIEFIEKYFPKKAIIKGNVGTEWQNIIWSALKEKEPLLWKEINFWTYETYSKEAEKKGITSKEQLMGTYSKNAFKPFKEKIDSLNEKTVYAIEVKAFEKAKEFIKAFGAKNSAEKIRKYMK